MRILDMRILDIKIKEFMINNIYTSSDIHNDKNKKERINKTSK